MRSFRIRSDERSLGSRSRFRTHWERSSGPREKSGRFSQPFAQSNAIGTLWALSYDTKKSLVLDGGFNRGLTSASTKWEVFAGFSLSPASQDRPSLRVLVITRTDSAGYVHAPDGVPRRGRSKARGHLKRKVHRNTNDSAIPGVKSRYRSLSQAEIRSGILRSQQLSGISFFFGVKCLPNTASSPVVTRIDGG